jgi:hypothetical protein
LCFFERSLRNPELVLEAGAAIARTRFFVLYSVFKEHRAEDGCCAPELGQLVGATPERARRP